MAQIRRHHFKLVGGHPALDFINTVHDWNVSEPHDYLSEFADAIRFGKAAGLLTRSDDLRLRPQTARVELTRLRELRVLLKRIFQMRLSGQAPRNMDLRKLSADLAEAARATRLIVATRTRRSSQVPVMREITAENAGDALLRLRIVEAAAAKRKPRTSEPHSRNKLRGGSRKCRHGSGDQSSRVPQMRGRRISLTSTRRSGKYLLHR